MSITVICEMQAKVLATHDFENPAYVASQKILL